MSKKTPIQFESFSDPDCTSSSGEKWTSDESPETLEMSQSNQYNSTEPIGGFPKTTFSAQKPDKLTLTLSIKEKEIELRYDLERNVKLVSFNKGKIDISFNEKLNQNFIKNLTEKLLLWTGDRWIISLSKNTLAKSIYEKNQEDKNNKIEEFKKSKMAQDVLKAFPDAKLIDLKEEE